MNKKVEKHLPELQKENLKCVFCNDSNQKVDGGYFKQKFVCRKCSNEFTIIENFLK